MEGSMQICPSCGKQNPENARFCYACGATLVEEPNAPAGQPPTAPSQTISDSFSEAKPEIADAPDTPTQPIPRTTAQTAYTTPAAQQGHPPAYPPQIALPSKPSRRGRVRCCAIGCLAVLLVLLIGLPILHVTVLRPFIEGEIYKQVEKSLEDVAGGDTPYYGADTETITERQLNIDAQDAWIYIPGSSEGHIYLEQDRMKIQVKVYGVTAWAATDLRVDNRGQFVVKSIKMNWLLHLVFSEGALKREIAKYANDKILKPKGLQVLAFQVNEGKLFIAYEQR